MAFTTIATANTTIGPSQFADMAQALAPRFLVDSPTDLQPSYSAGTVSVATGAALVAGTRVRATGSNSVSVPAVSSGSKLYAVVLRVDWAQGSNAASLQVVDAQVNGSSSPVSTQINRIPGIVYDALLCLITRSAGTTASAYFADMRCWGGDGGPIRVSDAALASPGWLDIRVGGFIQTDQGQYTKRKDNDGSWRAVGTDSNPWREWTPTLRYYSKSTIDGKTGGTIVGLGNGGTYSARYRIVDGLLDGYVYIQPGTTGATLGDGPITIDLPVACASWQEDTWSMGHLYTTTSYGADKNLDWHLEALMKKGWTRALLFTSKSGADSTMGVYQSQDPYNLGPGKGTPYVANGYPVGPITIHLSYPVA